VQVYERGEWRKSGKAQKNEKRDPPHLEKALDILEAPCGLAHPMFVCIEPVHKWEYVAGNTNQQGENQIYLAHVRITLKAVIDHSTDTCWDQPAKFVSMGS
jgi:hypothetical protein